MNAQTYEAQVAVAMHGKPPAKILQVRYSVPQRDSRALEVQEAAVLPLLDQIDLMRMFAEEPQNYERIWDACYQDYCDRQVDAAESRQDR